MMASQAKLIAMAVNDTTSRLSGVPIVTSSSMTNFAFAFLIGIRSARCTPVDDGWLDLRVADFAAAVEHRTSQMTAATARNTPLALLRCPDRQALGVHANAHRHPSPIAPSQVRWWAHTTGLSPEGKVPSERSNSASLLVRTLSPVQDRSRDSHGVPRTAL